jgi:hypothetical protein
MSGSVVGDKLRGSKRQVLSSWFSVLVAGDMLCERGCGGRAVGGGGLSLAMGLGLGLGLGLGA